MKTPKKHSPKLETLIFDREGLLAEVNSLEDGVKVIFFLSRFA